jgi:hypothetical protein
MDKENPGLVTNPFGSGEEYPGDSGILLQRIVDDGHCFF